MTAIKLLQAHLETLEAFQEYLFEQGHTFWHCDAQDNSHDKPFYYYQINRSLDMSTCSTCYQLMENRRKIRNIQKALGIELTPFYTNYKEKNHVKRVNAGSTSAPEFNINLRYIS